MSEIELPTSCEEATEVRARALGHPWLIEQLGVMERRIGFFAGYDHSDLTCGDGSWGQQHGRHGMDVRFILKGPHGAVQFVFNLLSFVPGNTDIIDLVRPTGPAVAIVPVTTPSFGDAMPVDLGYHSPRELYGGQLSPGDCELLDGARCYYDGSGLNAGPVLAAFLLHGPMAIWAALGDYYAVIFSQTPELESGDPT